MHQQEIQELQKYLISLVELATPIQWQLLFALSKAELREEYHNFMEW